MEMEQIGVLIVDDSARMRRAVKRHLKKMEGIRLSGAANTAGGVQRFKAASKIKFVVSDFDMPGPNGDQFYREIKEGLKARDASFVVLTSDTQQARDALKGENVEVFDKNKIIDSIVQIKKLIANKRDQ
jgi:DNA-binding NarL/FixJ family response regulator